MGKLIPIVVVLLGAGGGVGAGMMLKPAPDPCMPEDSEACLAEAEAAEKAEMMAKEAERADAEFAELKRQFVIPIVRDGRVSALVVASLALEIDTGATEAVFSLEPKLRDAFLQVMFVHAHSGGFDGTFTARQAMADLKERLNEVARPIIGASLHNVLITEIVRQDI